MNRIVSSVLLSCALAWTATPAGAAPDATTASGQPTLIPFQGNDGEWGYLDRETRRVVIAPRFSDAALFENGLGEVNEPNPKARSPTGEDANLTNWITPSGQAVFPEYFQDVSAVGANDQTYPDLRKVETKDGRYGIISLPLHQWVIPPQPSWNITFYAHDRILVSSAYLQVGDARYEPPKGTRITGVDFDARTFRITPASRDPQADHTFDNGLSDWHGHVLVAPRYLGVQYDPHSRRALGTRLGWMAQLLARVGLLTWLPNVAPVTDLLDDQGRVIRTFSGRYDVAFFRREGIGTYGPRDQGAPGATRYFDLATGKDVAAEQAVPATGPRIFEQDGRFGVKLPDGATALPARYTSLHFFNHDLLIARTDPSGQLGVIDLHGNVVVPFEYRFVDDDGMARIEATRASDGLTGVLDLQGHVAIDFKYRNTFYFVDGLAQVHDNGLTGVIDPHGKPVLPMIYKTLFDTHEIDKTDQVYYTAENKDGRWGLLSATGQVVAPFDYGYVSVDKTRFATGWVDVESPDRQLNGMVNIRTSVVIAPTYKSIALHDGFFVASTYRDSDNTYLSQLLDLRGKPLTERVYTSMDVIQGHFVMVAKDHRAGVLDAVTGTVRVPLRYRYLWDQGQGFVLAEVAPQRYVFVDFNGVEYRPKP